MSQWLIQHLTRVWSALAMSELMKLLWVQAVLSFCGLLAREYDLSC